MSDRRRANLESKFRGFAEEAILADEQRMLQLIRQVLTSSGLVRVERIGGTLPPNAHDTINDESVVVAFPAYSAAIDLQTLLDEILAAQAAPPLAIEEIDGDPSGSISTLIFPNGSIAFDDATDTAVLELLAWLTATVVAGSNVTITPVGDTLVIASTGGGSAIVVQEGDSTVVTVVDTLDFDASDFNVTETPTGEANISLAYGTSAGTPAEGNHTHSSLVLKVQEGDVDVDTAVTSIDFDASDFNVTSSPSGEANVSLAYGTSAGTPAEGNHTHSGVTITVEEGDSTVDAAVTNLDFDASDFNVTSSPAGEANIALAYGTSAGTPAEGNHTHTSAGITDFTEATQDVLGALLVDSTNIDFTYNDAGNAETVDLTAVAKTFTVNFVIDGGGSVIATGVKGVVQIDRACTIISNTLLADQSGSITLTIKKSTYSGYAGSLTSIVASAKPTISSAQKSTDATLTGWTTSVAAGDVLEITVDTIATLTRCTLALKCQAS